MIIVFVLVAVVIVVAIGLIAVGGATSRLAGQSPTAVFDIEEAVQFVADRLPDDATAVLTFDDVDRLVRWHIDYLEAKGMAGDTGDDLSNLPSGPAMATDDEAVAYVLGRASDAGFDVADVLVVEVLDGSDGYLRAIGAVGPVVPPTSS